MYLKVKYQLVTPSHFMFNSNNLLFFLIVPIYNNNILAIYKIEFMMFTIYIHIEIFCYRSALTIIKIIVIADALFSLWFILHCNFNNFLLLL